MRRTGYLALAALVLASVAAVTPAGAAAGAQDPAAAGAVSGHPGRWVPLRVATYNIHASAGSDNRFDLAGTTEAIRALRADIVGLQEVDVHWSARTEWRDTATEIARALRMHVFFAPIYSLDPLTAGAPRREYGVAVLSRHPILYAKNHEITRLSTQVPNAVPEPAPGFPEVVVFARGALLRVFDTHLDYRADPSVRASQVADMRRIMGRPGWGSKVLVGDFNAPPAAPELAPLWTGLRDAWAEANGTAGGLTYPQVAPDRRIDYVTVSGRTRVKSVTVPQTAASDHLPVVADLRVPAL
jgi:endonuclease/exonuclease/phosphatase family metal-dependent hydrolase